LFFQSGCQPILPNLHSPFRGSSLTTYFGGMVRCMQVARMANAFDKQCIPHISATGLGYVYMMRFVSAIPISGPLSRVQRVQQRPPYHCDTSTPAETPTA
jgi:L-alanine-DL-glutamate epimerase-like enolase superfamily enzyme